MMRRQRRIRLAPIRSPRTKNPSEIACLHHLQAQGWTVLRKGWPDFIAKRAGKVIAIEVKRNTLQSLSSYQRRVASWLTESGVTVYRWSPDLPHPTREL